jgi:glycosyltransferase involved in cell wall biosynthesis
MLAPEFLPVWGGVGTYIVDLVRHLPKDTEVHVVTPMREGFGKEKISSSDYDFSKYFGNNVHVHFISDANDTFVYNAKFQYNCLRQVPKLVKEYDLDIVHSHTAHMPDLLLQFKRLGIPVVTTIHTTIRGQRQGTRGSCMGFSGLEFSEKLTYLTYPFLSFAETVYFSSKRYYITVSNWMKQQITNQFPELKTSSISVIHNSVDTEWFSPGEKSFPRDIVLFTGRLVSAKGIGYLVEAMPKVLRNYPDALFVFIGAGNSLPYQNRLKEMGIPNRNYMFMGYLKEAKDLIYFYRGSSVYVAPTMYENLPIRVLEAMACGVPVVASGVCAIPEVIDHGVNGLLVHPGAVEELSKSICLLLGDPALRRKMGDNARKTVLDKFSWDVNASKTLNVYEQIANNNCKKLVSAS